ncbi:MAG: alpha/beta hydrolase [Paludibacterium sp.]|uniref:alpha/beta fold hydrolase n=1 Tax=Paludibacterium sp. TaxID=1917523 RepID=UPI0025E7FF38|nr:alpha/beta hydrolase [Paludibacterium sp.]MBV8047662.1 alpha/beta hydrolase [Paludibacterium sp.]MBV8648397.1 alpha/beta hydrolase [Paludibacterium sp.]
MKQTNSLQGWSRWLRRMAAVVALAAVVVPQRSHAEPVAPGLRNIVLVHGAFADGSSWSEVIAILQRKGYHVTTVQNPLTSLADDVAATRRVLERQKGGVLLVGHSWAGVVVTEAGNAPNVKGLVYLSALVPDSNESVGDLLTRLHAPMAGLKPDEHGLIWLDDPEAYRQVMAGDVPAAKARLLAAVQQPIAAGAFGEKVSHAAWRDKPSWYLITENDHALLPAVQWELAQETGAHRVTLKSSHMSMVSHPADIARLIDRAARELSR